MWIFCGGMARSGSTLQFQLTAHLVERAGRGSRIEWAGPGEDWRDARERYAGVTSWKVCKTHACTPEMRAEFENGNAKGVYVFRDVRDVIVSRMKLNHESFDRTWDRTLRSILTKYEDWTNLDAVLVSRYDEVMADPAAEVQRIARHLDIAVDRAECEKIASEYTLERQRQRIGEATAKGRLLRSKRWVFEPDSQLHLNHLSSGRTGEWQEHLSREQVALIESRAGDWLVGNGFALSVPAWQRPVLTSSHAVRKRISRLSRRLSGKRSGRMAAETGPQPDD